MNGPVRHSLPHLHSTNLPTTPTPIPTSNYSQLCYCSPFPSFPFSISLFFLPPFHDFLPFPFLSSHHFLFSFLSFPFSQAVFARPRAPFVYPPGTGAPRTCLASFFPSCGSSLQLGSSAPFSSGWRLLPLVSFLRGWRCTTSLGLAVRGSRRANLAQPDFTQQPTRTQE